MHGDKLCRFNINHGSYFCLFGYYHAAWIGGLQHIVILKSSTFWLYKNLLITFPQVCLCAEATRKLRSLHLSLCVFPLHQHHHCQWDDRNFVCYRDILGKSRPWWTISGADSSVKWAATLTWILIAVSEKPSLKPHNFSRLKCLQLWGICLSVYCFKLLIQFHNFAGQLNFKMLCKGIT